MVVLENPQDITDDTHVYFNSKGDRACVALSIEQATSILGESAREAPFMQIGICVYEQIDLTTIEHNCESCDNDQ